MYRTAEGPGVDPLTHTRSFRLLTHTAEVTAPSREVADQLSFLASVVDQRAVPELRRTSYHLRAGGEHVDLFEEGARFATAATAAEAVLALADRVRRCVLDYLARGGWLPLDAGLASLAGRRLLVLGGSPGARGLLLAQLLGGEARVEGSDVVVVRGGMAVGYPAPLWLGARAAGKIAALRPLLGGLPSLSVDGAKLVSLDPALVSRTGPLTPGPVHAIVMLDDAPGPPVASSATPGALRAVLEARIDTAARDPAVDVAEAARVAGGVPAWTLGSAPPEAAAAALREWLAGW